VEVAKHAAVPNHQGFFASGLFGALLPRRSVVVEIGPPFNMFERQMLIDFLKRIGIEPEITIRRGIERVGSVTGRAHMPILAERFGGENVPTTVPDDIAVGIFDGITGMWRAVGIAKDVPSYGGNVGIGGDSRPRKTPEPGSEPPATLVPGLWFGNAATPGDAGVQFLLQGRQVGSGELRSSAAERFAEVVDDLGKIIGSIERGLSNNRVNDAVL
jgi:hypothetical protein